MMNGTSHHLDRNCNGFVDDLMDGFVNGTPPRSSTEGCAAVVNSSPSYSSSSVPGNNYIEHRVSKMDTLAGVAIRYGVEVADIRRMNGLVTDLQMFALDVLQIPLPGRHPPSPAFPNGSTTNGEYTPPRRSHDDVVDSLQSVKMKPPRRVSPAMSSLRGYYGLTPPRKGSKFEAEMAVYWSGGPLSPDEQLHTKASPASDPGFNLNRKSRSLVSLGDVTFEDKEVAETGDGRESERFIRRRQRFDTESSTPEILLEDNSGGFFGRIRRGLALRPKLGTRADIDAAGRQNSLAATAGEFFNDVLISMRKSSSTSSLQESESSSFLWSTSKWSLKTETISRPIFDGLPKPMTSRRNKAALD